METSNRIRIVVIGIGNIHRGDDAVGVEFCRRIRQLAPREVAVLEHSGDPTVLMDAWAGADAVFLVDAAHSRGRVGEIHRFDAHVQSLPAELFGASTHVLGVDEAVELARTLGESPDRLIVYAIRGCRFEHRAVLSPEVDEACDELVAKVLDEIRGLLKTGASN